MRKKKLKKKLKKLLFLFLMRVTDIQFDKRAIISEFLKYNPKIEFTIFNNKRLLFLKEYFGNKLNYKYYQNTLHTIKKK